MKRTSVDSSMMASVGYNAAQRVLEIEFQTGDTYQYFDVPLAVYRSLLAAPSKGRFSHANLHGVYSHEPLAPARRRSRGRGF
jgi:KTSC domain-containing protein